MALPVINENKHFIKINLPNGKKIGVRGWVVRDEKELLFAIESEENTVQNKLPHIISFLRRCVDDEILFDNLSEESLKKIVIECRKLAKGDRVEYTYPCPHCRAKIIDEVKLSKDEQFKPFDFSPVKVNDKLTITLKDLSYAETTALEERFVDSDAKLEYYFIINSIEGVTYDNQVFTTFTEEEMDDFIGQLESDELTIISDALYNNRSSISLERKLTCHNCNKEIDVEFGDLFHFLVL